jgi:hypothetical protein
VGNTVPLLPEPDRIDQEGRLRVAVGVVRDALNSQGWIAEADANEIEIRDTQDEYIGTVVVRTDREHLRRCGHKPYRDGHCAEMSCPNYIAKHMH